MFILSLALAIAEIIAAVICLAFIQGKDLRRQLSLYYTLTCVGAVVIMLFNWLYTGKSEVPTAVGFLLLYVGIVTTFNMVYLIVNELFPTIFLATSYGCVNIVGRAITVLSPLVAEAPNPIPLTILGIYSFICIFLPFGLIKYKKQ
jgi:hypothetical protein